MSAALFANSDWAPDGRLIGSLNLSETIRAAEQRKYKESNLSAARAHSIKAGGDDGDGLTCSNGPGEAGEGNAVSTVGSGGGPGEVLDSGGDGGSGDGVAPSHCSVGGGFAGGGGVGCSAGGGGGVDVGHWFVGSPGLASGGGERWCRAA